MTRDTAITVDDVTKRYGSVTALDGVSLSVERGTTFGLLGTNGAGKSTLFGLLVGHATPDAGDLRVGGRDVASAGTAIRRRVGYLPERAGFPDELTAREVLAFHARMRDLADRSERVDRVLDRVGLAAAADRPVGEFSKGMGRRLGLATALLPRPEILLLDEPTAGLDPLGVAALHRVVRDLRAEGDLTLVLSTHVLSEAESLCDRVAILHDGRLLATGSPGDFHEEGTVRVRIDVADAGARADVTDLVAAQGGDVTGSRGTTVEAACPADRVPGLLDAVLDADSIEGYEVRESSLRRAFVDEIRDAGSTTEAPPADETGVSRE